MNQSQLIIHTAKTPYFCCCYYGETLMLAATPRSVQLWDFIKGQIEGEFLLPGQLAPLALHKFKKHEDISWCMLQDKSGFILIFTYSQTGKKFQLQNSYQIEMIGFTRLPLTHYSISQSQQITAQLRDCYHTISYPQTIQRRSIISGKIQQAYELEETSLADVSFMLNLTIGTDEFLIVAEEGASIQKIALCPEEIEVKEKLNAKTSQQIKIILYIEPVAPDRAIAVLRQDRLLVIRLQVLSVERQIDLKFPRILKSISVRESYWALVGRDRIALMRREKLIKSEKLHTSLIMDMDVCDYGVLGVTQQGKSFFLPLEEP